MVESSPSDCNMLPKLAVTTLGDTKGDGNNRSRYSYLLPLGLEERIRIRDRSWKSLGQKSHLDGFDSQEPGEIRF